MGPSGNRSSGRILISGRRRKRPQNQPPKNASAVPPCKNKLMPDSSAMVATASHYRPMRPVREELLSPSAYLRVMGSQKGNIAHAQAIPPAPGKRGYGKIRVQYRMPVIRSHGA